MRPKTSAWLQTAMPSWVSKLLLNGLHVEDRGHRVGLIELRAGYRVLVPDFFDGKPMKTGAYTKDELMSFIQANPIPGMYPFRGAEDTCFN